MHFREKQHAFLPGRVQLRRAQPRLRQVCPSCYGRGAEDAGETRFAREKLTCRNFMFQFYCLKVRSASTHAHFERAVLFVELFVEHEVARLPRMSPPSGSAVAQRTYASAYAARGRRSKAAASALVLAPGSHIMRLGFAGAAVPAATLPASELPLAPAGAFASALLLAAAAHLHLPSRALRDCALIVAVPPTGLPPAARAALARAATGLLRMRAVVLAPAAPAAALAAGAAHGGARAVVVDVGWHGARVCTGAAGAAVGAAPAGMREVAAALRDAGVAEGDMEDAMGVVYVREERPEEGELRLEGGGEGGDAVGEEGRVVVGARVRWSACEVLFADGALAEAVVEALRGRDVYARAAGAHWVVACGGAAGVPGFAARLRREVAAGLATGVGSRVRVVCPGPAAAWVGASLLGCIGRERYGDSVEVVTPEPEGAA